jgi:hypothetical protein
MTAVRQRGAQESRSRTQARILGFLQDRQCGGEIRQAVHLSDGIEQAQDLIDAIQVLRNKQLRQPFGDARVKPGLHGVSRGKHFPKPDAIGLVDALEHGEQVAAPKYQTQQGFLGLRRQEAFPEDSDRFIDGALAASFQQFINATGPASPVRREPDETFSELISPEFFSQKFSGQRLADGLSHALLIGRFPENH